MPDYREIIFALLLVVSICGCVHSIYIYDKGKVLKRLQELNNRSTMTELLIEEYKHFFEIKWWHWLSWIAFAATSVGIILDSY